jgi:hypothetical protein
MYKQNIFGKHRLISNIVENKFGIDHRKLKPFVIILIKKKSNVVDVFF